jgi:hypothetical protein
MHDGSQVLVSWLRSAVAGDDIAINKNEQLALRDFYSEVYEAWDRLPPRTELARNALYQSG